MLMAVNSLSDSIKWAWSEALQLEELSAKDFGSKKTKLPMSG